MDFNPIAKVGRHSITNSRTPVLIVDEDALLEGEQEKLEARGWIVIKTRHNRSVGLHVI